MSSLVTKTSTVLLTSFEDLKSLIPDLQTLILEFPRVPLHRNPLPYPSTCPKHGGGFGEGMGVKGGGGWSTFVTVKLDIINTCGDL